MGIRHVYDVERTVWISFGNFGFHESGWQRGLSLTPNAAGFVEVAGGQQSSGRKAVARRSWELGQQRHLL